MGVTKHEVKRVIDDVDSLDLPDGAHWALIHDRLGLEYGAVFEFIAADPAFFSALPSHAREGDIFTAASGEMQRYTGGKWKTLSSQNGKIR